jgi:hypothetical protein
MLWCSVGFDISCSIISNYKDVAQVFKKLGEIFNTINKGLERFARSHEKLDSFDKLHESLYVKIQCMHSITNKFFIEFIACDRDNDVKWYVKRINPDQGKIEISKQNFQNAIHFLLLAGSILNYESIIEFNS